MKTKNSKQSGGNSNSNQLTISNTPVSPNLQKEKPIVITRIPYDVKIFSFLCILGLVIRILFTSNGEYAKSTVWGYGFSILSLFGLIISSFAISSKDQINLGIKGFFTVILKNAFPIILSIIILSLILAQNISFYDNINSNRVAPQYYQFSGISGFLILIQISLVINYLMDKLKGSKTTSENKSGILEAMASELASIILILSVINVGIIGVLQVILKYFSTDG
jgi:hypothetical protein